MNKRVLGIVAGVCLVVLAAGAAYAAIPDSGGEFHACVDGEGGNKGDVRIIDHDAGESCLAAPKERHVHFNEKGQQGGTGPQGATGPQGPAGPGVLAYAVVRGFEEEGDIIEARSSGVTDEMVTHPDHGVYCFNLPGTVKAAVATIGFADLGAIHDDAIILVEAPPVGYCGGQDVVVLTGDAGRDIARDWGYFHIAFYG